MFVNACEFENAKCEDEELDWQEVDFNLCKTFEGEDTVDK